MVLHQTVRRAVVGVLALVLTLAASATPAHGQAAGLSLVPIDAPVVLVIPSLTKFSLKIAALNRAMGLNFPQLDDALGGFKQQMGAAKGFRDDGPLVVVLTSIENFGAGEPPIVMLMPVTNYAEFVGNYGGKADEAVTAVQLSGGVPGFAKKIDGYAVMGPRKDLVEAFKAGNNAGAIQTAVGKVGSRVIETSDAFLYVNVAVVAPILQPKVQMMPAMAMAMMGNAPGVTPASREILQTEMNIYGAIVAAGLRDITAMVIGLDSNDLGLGMTASMQLRPGSFLADALGNGGEAAPQLAKVPNQPYIFAEAINFQGVKVKALLDQFVSYLTPTQPAIAQLITKLGSQVDRCKSMAGAYYVPPAGAGVMALTSPTTIGAMDTTDGKAYMQENQKNFLALNNTTISFNIPAAPGAAPAPAPAPGQPAPAADAPGVTFNTTYAANELQVDGVSVDRYQLQMKINGLNGDGANGMGPLAPLLAAGSSRTGYIAASGNQVISTTSLDPALVKQALASIKNGHGLGEADTIAKVRQNLGPKASVEVYVSVSGIVSMVNSFIAMMGNPPINAPADLLPIGMSVNFQDNGIAERGFVPVSVVKFAYTTVMPMVSGMMGGGPGGPAQPRQGPAPAPF